MTSRYSRGALFVLALTLVAAHTHSSAIADETEDPVAAAKTITDPATAQEVSVERLDLMLKPLSKAELETEAMGWVALLQRRVQNLTDAQLGVRDINRRIDEINNAAAESPAEVGDTAPQPEAPKNEALEAATAEKDELLKRITTLTEQRVALSDRVNTVLASLETKGGDAADYHKYVDAVSGIAVDASDLNAVWNTAIGWLRSKEGGLRWGRNIALFLVTLIVAWILAGMAARAMRRALRASRRASALLQEFAVSFTYRAVLIVGLIIAVSMLEVSVGPVLAIIGAAGLVVGLALQGTLSNFAAGILILAYRPFDIGDVVTAGGVTGKIEALNLVSTTVITPDNQRMIIPNNSVWENVITNITGNPTRRVDMVFGTGYGDDLKLAQKTLEGILAKHDLVLKDPAPVVLVHELADSSVNFIVRPWVNTADYWTVYWDVTRAVKDRFDEVGLSIPFPQRDIHVHQVEAAPIQ
ncbi:MAG: mechanosensitive ion channel family protein [Phycisphaerales bacterium]|nr:mechanosensitive ion channel family protein [Phycisphaerales bacterium]